MATKNSKPVMRPTGRTFGTPAGATVVPPLVMPKIERNTDQETMQLAIQGASQAPKAITADKPTGFHAARIAMEGEEYVIGQNYRIPHPQLLRSKNNARIYYTSDDLNEMGESLRTNGQLQPALGYVKDGKVILTDGGKRFLAAAAIGVYDLEVKIIAPPESEAEEYEKSRLINLERSAQTGIDDAFKWRELLDRGVYESQEQLGQRLGLEKAKVSKILAISRIPERLIKQMVEHPQTSAWTVAYQISLIFEAKQVEQRGSDQSELIGEEVIEEIVKNELSKNQVEALVRKRLEGPRKRAQAESSPVKFGDAKGEMKVFPSRGQLDLSFRNLPEAKVNELKDLIERALSGQIVM